ncbi:GUN4 domain-containing protein [Microcystis aeruginosa]|uniref:Serine/threonine kinase n=2 Tax=Microcystis aeruginosa TaxID=1126 RepID=I4INF4_MICAE
MSLQREVELKSDAGMDYSKLRDLLKAGKWKEADEETLRVMLAVAKREKEGYLTVEDIDNFPCADLRTIDQLWIKYSDGRFGFSVQKRIYQSLGGTGEYSEKIWEKFGDKVGWRKGSERLLYWMYYSENNITFDKYKAPEGHLPWYYEHLFRGSYWRVSCWVSFGLWCFLSRGDL